MTETAITAMLVATFVIFRKALAVHDPRVRARARMLLGDDPSTADRSGPSPGARRWPQWDEAQRVRRLRWILAGAGALSGAAFGPASIAMSPLLGLAGYKVPDLAQSVRTRSRKAEISAGLSEAVDMLAVCTKAGLNLPLALDRVAARTPGALGWELRRALDEVALGVPRREAMEAMARRNGIHDLDALVSTLNNSERFGTQVASALETFAQEVRAKRRRQAEEQGRRAPVKILFPLVFLILPAFILLTVAPLLLGTFRSLGF